MIDACALRTFDRTSGNIDGRSIPSAVACQSKVTVCLQCAAGHIEGGTFTIFTDSSALTHNKNRATAVCACGFNRTAFQCQCSRISYLHNAAVIIAARCDLAFSSSAAVLDRYGNTRTIDAQGICIVTSCHRVSIQIKDNRFCDIG